MSILDDLLSNQSILVTCMSNNVVMMYASGNWQSYISSNPMGVDFYNQNAVLSSINGIGLYNNSGQLVANIPIVDTSTHEIKLLWDNTIAGCSTPNSLIQNYNFGGKIPMWVYPGVDPSNPDNRCMINGLALNSGSLGYATALGVTDSSGQGRVAMMSGSGGLIDLQASSVVFNNLAIPHSPIVLSGSVLFCNSGTGDLMCWEIGSPSYSSLINLGAFCRGISQLDSTHFLVGISQARINAPSVVTVPTNAQAGVALVDISTPSVVHFEPLDVSEVFDICITPGMILQ